MPGLSIVGSMRAGAGMSASGNSLFFAARKPKPNALAAPAMASSPPVPPATASYLAYSTAKDPLATLRAGLYDIVVRDASPRGGLFVQKAHKKAVLIAGVSFTGKRTVQVDLTAGRWTFFSSGGKPVPFVVTV